MSLRVPKIVAAHRLQIYLLVAALVAVVLGCLLFSDLVRTFRSTVVADANKVLANAVRELFEAESIWVGKQPTPPISWPFDRVNESLRDVSYNVLGSYPDVEGGYLRGDQVIGQSFPTYTEPGSELKQPEIERHQVLAAIDESRARLAAPFKNPSKHFKSFQKPVGLRRNTRFRDHSNARVLTILIVAVRRCRNRLESSARECFEAWLIMLGMGTSRLNDLIARKAHVAYSLQFV